MNVVKKKTTTHQPFSLFPIVFRLGFYRTLYFSSSYDNVYMPLSLSGSFQRTHLQGFKTVASVLNKAEINY